MTRSVKYSKQEYLVHERIECFFDDRSDAEFWSRKMRAKGYKTSGEDFGKAVGMTYRVLAIRNHKRKTFQF